MIKKGQWKRKQHTVEGEESVRAAFFPLAVPRRLFAAIEAVETKGKWVKIQEK